MCDMCKPDGSTENYQDCGAMICFDEPPNSGDDILRRAYVTESGDLFCERCGRKYDKQQEQQDAEDSMGFDIEEI